MNELDDYSKRRIRRKRSIFQREPEKNVFLWDEEFTDEGETDEEPQAANPSVIIISDSEDSEEHILGKKRPRENSGEVVSGQPKKRSKQ